MNFVEALTFIIRISVLTVIEKSIKYSKPDELTSCQILYFIPNLFVGTNRCRGLAFIAKSMQDFFDCKHMKFASFQNVLSKFFT